MNSDFINNKRASYFYNLARFFLLPTFIDDVFLLIFQRRLLLLAVSLPCERIRLRKGPAFIINFFFTTNIFSN